MADFDPDAYLGTPAAPTGGFDPDAYLASTPTQALPQRHWWESPAGRTGGEMGQPGAFIPGGKPTAKEQAAVTAGAEGLAMGVGAPILAGMEIVAPESYRKLEAGYQAQRALAGDKGIDVPRAAAESIYMGLMPEIKGASALARMGKTAGYNALIGAMTPTQQTQPGSTLVRKGEQALTAGGLGLAGGAVGEAVGKVPGKAAGTTDDPLAGLSGPDIAKATRQVDEFVTQKMGINKNELVESVYKQLLTVARNAKTLDKLDPAAVARLNKLRSVGITEATQGQLTRDPLQRQAEIQAQQLAGGEDLRQLTIQQNKQLLDNLSLLRGDRGVLPYESTGAGRGVREALEAKYQSLKRGVSRLYRTAERVAGDTPVNAGELADHVNTHGDPGLIPYVKNKLPKDAYVVDENGLRLTRELTLKELEIVRKAATTAKLAGGDKGHYAGEITDLIDRITEGKGGEAYAAARAARRKVGEEFERTRAVESLVKTRGLSKEKAVALEDVWRQSVITGSVEDLLKLKDSLTKPVEAGRLGAKRTQALVAKGTKAFDDVRAATADYLLSKATRGPSNMPGDPVIGWNAFRNAVNEIGPEKLEILYGKAGAKKLKDAVEALEIIKTEDANAWKGSPTFKHLLGVLDTLGGLGGKYIGTEFVAGAVKQAAKLKEMGAAGRTARAAVQNPLEKAAREGQTLESLRRKGTIPTITITRGMADQQDQPQ